jgi:membrane-bound lytic murein transglycosylase D
MLKFISLATSLLSLVLILGFMHYQLTREQGASPVPAGADYPALPPLPLEDGERHMARSIPLPVVLEFAGEPVPLHIPDVRERLDRELHINTYWQNNTIFLIKRAHRWLPQLEKILKENGIPDDFKYLAVIESGLLNEVSPRGAVGFWQIIESAGKEFGLEINNEVDERYDPLKSTTAACKYLRKAHQKFGTWTNAAASYNRGMSGLQRAIDDQQVKDYYDLLLNEETSRYVFRILAIKEIIENPRKYGFYIDPSHLYQAEPLRTVVVTSTIPDLVSFAHRQGVNYKLLKRHNPWLRKDKLTVKRNERYEIHLPM